MEDLYFIHFDADGNFLGRYISASSFIPPEAIAVPEKLFMQTIEETDGEWKLDITTGKVKKHAPTADAATPEQIEAHKVAIVQSHMDAAAQALRYDNITTAITYAEEPAVPKFQAEGQALRAWRSLVWSTCYAILDDVNAGRRGIPTDAELIDALPALELPE